MSICSLRLLSLMGLVLLFSSPVGSAAGAPLPPEAVRGAESLADPKKPEAKKEKGKAGEGAQKKEDEKKAEKKDELDDFDEVTKEAQKIEGLLTFHRKKEKLYLELKPEQLDRDYLFTITLESGIGARGIYNGMPLRDYLCRFRRVNDQLFFVHRNPWFRARPGHPSNRSLERAFTDSVLVSMKLESVHKERKTLLVDAAPLFLGDLPGLGPRLRAVLGTGYNLDASKSYYGQVKSFPQNAELQTHLSFNAGEPRWIEPLPDSRNLTLRIHYSLSELPQSSYRPRMADDRVGYFITVYQDVSNDETVTPYVRYVNRWHLEKKDPDAPLSEPKKPIVFWLENTIPLEYRDAIRAGVLRWNLAFEKAGFKDAIVVKQMPDDADWDPADVRYNTIRWLHSMDSAFAMGPSRVNPLTGEILDADIVIDANFVRYVKHGYRASVPHGAGASSGTPDWLKVPSHSHDIPALLGWPAPPVMDAETLAHRDPQGLQRLCMAGPMMAHQARFAATAIALRDGMSPGGEVPKEYLDQFWADLVAHEVGHTLGLRHNFHASTMLPLHQLHNRAVVAEKGLWSSVMDYNAVNIASTKAEQGYYYSPRVGPYDVWAIEYGYTPITAAGTEEELPALHLIAERGTEHDLAYATDEDLYDFGGPTAVDPLVMAGDLSDDPIGFMRQRVQLAKLLLKRLEARGPGQGKSYEEFRRDFGWTMGAYWNAAYQLSRWIGGHYFRRNHAGDKGERLPLEPVPAAKQREALNAIRQLILAENAFQFSPETLNKLAPSRWWHLGQNPINQPIDYPILQMIEAIQWGSIARLYHPVLMRRLVNTELKVASPKDALTLPELFTGLTNSVWSEVISSPARSIAASRRGLQRTQLERLVTIVVRPEPGTPGDARALARSELQRLRTAIRKALAPAPAGARPLDAYTRAHLEEADSRITKALGAPLLTQ